MSSIKIKKTIFSAVAISIPTVFLFATDAPKSSTTNASVLGMNINMVLLAISVLLVFPVYILSDIFLLTIKKYVKEKLDNSGKVMSILFLMLCTSSLLQAQIAPNEVVETSTGGVSSNLITYLLMTVIFLESVVIITFAFKIKNFLSPKTEAVEEVEESSNENWIEKYWAKMNNFRPITEEADLDTGHSYDGIRELDNVTPAWFRNAFILSIIFAFGYLYRYHVSQSAPLQTEEYNIEMAEAEVEQNKMLALQANKVDENSVKLLTGADIDAGKAIFVSKCSPCHGAKAASTPGGVGPNLTDDHWLHGGSVTDIFKTIKYGWPDKGMISWKDQLSPNQIAQIASYVLSTKGTVTSGGKEPQGEIYTPNSATSDSTNVQKIDSSKTTSIEVKK